MRLICPWCGERDAGEFTYRGDATATRPVIGEDVLDDHLAYIYDRKNSAGDHDEIWQHTGGCRTHMQVTRNTVTHAITEQKPLGPWADQIAAGAS